MKNGTRQPRWKRSEIEESKMEAGDVEESETDLGEVDQSEGEDSDYFEDCE